MSRKLQQLLIVLLLGGIVFVSALFLVQMRHNNRVLFTELQQLQNERDRLNVEWGQLQLELSTWAQSQRIENVARESLDMHPPLPNEIKVIRP